MPRHHRQKALEPLPAALDDLIRKPVGEDLAGENGDVDAGGLALEDVAEGLKVRVAPADERVPEFEGRDVCLWNERWEERQVGMEVGKRGGEGGEGVMHQSVRCITRRALKDGAYLGHNLVVGIHLPSKAWYLCKYVGDRWHRREYAQHTVGLWIPYLNLEEALGDAVHLLYLRS
jgi:hypothetical protein